MLVSTDTVNPPLELLDDEELDEELLDDDELELVLELEALLPLEAPPPPPQPESASAVKVDNIRGVISVFIEAFNIVLPIIQQ